MKKMLITLLVSFAFSFNALAAVNINTATQAELESLPEIGPVKAKAIIDYRKKNSGFKSIDELEKVDGIGAVTLKNIRKDVAISGKTTVVDPATKKATAIKKMSDTSKKTTEKKTPAKKTVEDTKPKTEKATN
ncbi:MAG: ComEA family DNA-binding protein [Methylotenera sp.]|nr:ComEA family DNA-binding protein [Methylotenera sp.]